MDPYLIADKLLSLQLKWIAAADAKVPQVFAIDVAMLGVLVALAPAPSKWNWGLGFFAGTAFFSLGCSVFFLALATFPRLTGPPGSLHYFGGITALREVEYIDKMRSSTPDLLTEDMYRQVYRNAQIAGEKFYFVWWAMVCAFGSLPFWLIALWLINP